MTTLLQRLVFSIRALIGRFIAAYYGTLFYKAGRFVAADKIEGDYLEFGVFSGATFASAFHSIRNAFSHSSLRSIWNTEQDRIDRRQLWKQMRFIAFDSFQGLPEPTGIDSVSSDFTKGKFASSEDQFAKRIMSSGVPTERVVIVPGWFHETLNDDTIKTHGIKHAAIVHIDCDLYESAKLVLEFIKPLLVDGTIILFDDWYNFRGNPQLGEQRAFREWLDENPEWMATQYHKEHVWRNSFIMSRAISSD